MSHPGDQTAPMHFLDNKIPPLLVAAGFGLAIWGLSTFVPALDLGLPLKATLSLLALCAAIFFGVAGVVSFRRARTTVNPHHPESASALVTSGIYRVTRNPMYLAMALLLTALAVWLAFPWSLLGVLGFVLYIDRFQIVPEERVLTELFGDEYRRYRARVRRWL